VLVCGGRDFTDRETVFGELDRLHRERRITLVVHGGAHGADELAGEWASSRRIACRVFHADWRAYGKAAGPIRNKQMIDEGRPDLVVAFEGGRGTAGMVSLAREARLEIVVVRDQAKSPAA
jgi:YspA, cpYpsA-related SLOG family